MDAIKERINDLARARTYYAENPWLYPIFPTVLGFVWWLKKKRPELEAAGASLRPGRDILIVPSRFPAVVARLKGLMVEEPAQEAASNCVLFGQVPTTQK